MSDTLDAIIEAAKKFPTRLLGGPVDMVNLIAGGYDNIVKLTKGEDINKAIGEGLVPKPVGGSEWLNDRFNLSNNVSGKEALAGATMDMLTPNGVLTGAAKAMIIPAALVIKDSDKLFDLTLALQRSDRSVATQAKVFDSHQVYVGPGDGQLRTTLDLKPATLKKQNFLSVGPLFHANPKTVKTLNDVLDYPEFFKYYPEAKNIPVSHKYGMLNGASFNTVTKEVNMGAATEGAIWGKKPLSAEDNWKSMLVHELQHYVQGEEGFMRGGGSILFYDDFAKFHEMSTKVAIAREKTVKQLTARYGFEEFEIMNPWMITAPSKQDAKAAMLNDPAYGPFKVLDRQAAEYHNKKQLAHDYYERIYGEAEARAVQRMAETPDYPVFPLTVYDRPVDTLIPNPTEPAIKVTNPSGAPIPPMIQH